MLYHSDLNFHRRLYDEFDVDLFCVHLADPLGVIMSSPLIYIRELTPCLTPLTQLHVVSNYCLVSSAVFVDVTLFAADDVAFL